MRRLAAAITLLFAIGAASTASAYPDGRYDAATPDSGGCGSCHSSVLGAAPTPLVRVLILLDNTPIDQFAGYVPGQAYDVSVWVLGPIVPFAGFNLKVSAGTLVNKDATSQFRMRTECGVMEGSTFPACQPGVAGHDCMVKGGAACPVYDLSDPDCGICSPTEQSNTTLCRSCNDTVLVDIQATHTLSSPTAAKIIPNWDLEWTAPSAGDVVFYAAGNSVSGEGQPTNDLWNFLDPNPVVLHPAP